MTTTPLSWLANVSPERRLLLGLLLLVTCLYSLLARDSYCGDFRAYYVAAQASHAGLDPYVNNVNVNERYADQDWLEQDSRFIYPPSSLFLFAPLGHLSYRLAKVVFATGMALLMAGILFALSGRYPRASWIALGLFLSLPMAANVDNGQVDILIFALVLAAFFASKPWLGGVCLGIAIAVKFSPVLVLLWLFLNRRFATALWSIGVSGALSLLAARWWGIGMYREFLHHLRSHLAPHPHLLTHTFHDGVMILGRFVIMGTSTYSMHYFYGTRQNPLLVLGSSAGMAGLLIVSAFVTWLRLSPRGHGLPQDASFYLFLVAALFANTLLWPAGLVACFPLTMLLVQRSRTPIAHGLLLLLPFYAPIEFIANRRFLFWLFAAAWCFWNQSSEQQKSLHQEALA